jgi:hypothetical protein
MTGGELLAWRRFQEGRKRYPGVGRLSFRDTGKGWVVTPDYAPRASGSVRAHMDGPRKARIWQSSSVPWSKRFCRVS